jgi:hypothetical protein
LASMHITQARMRPPTIARLRSRTPQPAPQDLLAPDLMEWREVVAVERREAVGCVWPVGECGSRAFVVAQLLRAWRGVDRCRSEWIGAWWSLIYVGYDGHAIDR